MTTPTIGFGKGAGVRIDLSRLIESRLLVQANSGGGKSRAIRYIAEQTSGDVQQIILDREGEFSTLRERFPYLLVGKDGDVAADLRTAKLLARKVMELGLSVVIDLSEMSLAQQREYVAAFVSALNHLPRPLWHDCLVVIDEAHLFAPESGKGSSVATEAIAMLLSTGRKRGYCGVLATQRLSKLSKDVAAECLNKLIGRTSNEDVKRAADELDQGKSEARELRSLEPGTFWAYGPAIAPEPVLVRTGEVSTAPPARGAARAPTAPPAGKIKAALAELADLPKQAADEERTIAELEQLNRQLRADLARAQREGTVRTVEKVVVDHAAIERAVEEAQTMWANNLRAVVKHDLSELDANLLATENAARYIEKQLAAIRANYTELARALAPHEHAKPGALLAPTEHRRNPSSPATSRSGSRPSVAPAGMQGEAAGRDRQPSDAAVSRPQQRMLDALASFEAIGMAELAYSHLAVFSDQSSRSSGFRANLSALSASGLVERLSGGRVRLTSAGRSAASSSDRPATLGQLHDAWLERLSGPQRLMLTLLIGAHPGSLDRDELARSSGQSPLSSGYRANLSTLSALGLLERRAGEVAATSLLFPEGLQ